jgi:hypothetical protein
MLFEEFTRRSMRSLIAVARDLPRQSTLALERPPEKRFGGCNIPLGAEQEIDCLSFFVDSSGPFLAPGLHEPMHAVVGAPYPRPRSSSNSRCVERRSRLGNLDPASRISVSASTQPPSFGVG